MWSPMRLDIDARDPFERGRERGSWVGAHLRETWPCYQELFSIAARDSGREPVDVQGMADACHDSVSAWSPALARELEGVAAGADVPLRTVLALNARTEVLAQAGALGVTECSTVVQLRSRTGSPLGAQTWDWHAELSNGWHVQTVRGDERSFVGLTEYGLLAKIGVNDAGVGVHFNLLNHDSDIGHGSGSASVRGGVPVHLLARQVLGRAASFGQAVELIGSAPVCASSVITVVTPEGAACVEISPAGIGVIEPSDGWLVHTNHFLDLRLASGERETLGPSTTHERDEFLRSRVKSVSGPLDVVGLTELLNSHEGDDLPEGDGAPVCRHPVDGAPTGYRTATLATVGLDPARRQAHIWSGGPCRRTDETPLTAHFG